ncbi:MAG: GNAT family N-acetyltransferase [Deltaproteobacteria bacterium]|nr:GNAT family N-acetyltransferase [Deltaproteobacteria bacterium]
MGKQGRFGKYGETKRVDRLRRARIGTPSPHGSEIRPFRSRPSSDQTFYKKPHAKISLAGDTDARFITRLSGKVFEIYGAYEEMVPKWFESEMTVTIIARMNRQPVGFAMIGDLFNRYDIQNASELLAIAVDTKKRRKGIGELLIREIDRKAADLNIKRIFLHTALENYPAQRLFAGNGYRPWKVKTNFYPAGQDAIVMLKDIRGW